MLKTARALGIAMCALAAASGPAQAARLADARHADGAYLMVGGRQTALLLGLPALDLSSRLAAIRTRLIAAVTKDGTVQPHPPVTVTRVGATPVLSIGAEPICSITRWEAERTGTDAAALATKVAQALDAGLATLHIGSIVPAGFIGFRDLSGQAIALAALSQPAAPLSVTLAGGRVIATIAGGVVTLTGQVDTLASKLAVERQVAATPGVVDIVNRVVVTAPRALSDDDLAAALAGVSALVP